MARPESTIAMRPGPSIGALALVVAFLALLAGCAAPLELPPSPLYDFGRPQPSAKLGLAEARAALLGHYAHYDVVTYEDLGTKTPMRTFVISYGFTDFVEREGRLYQIDRFVHASHRINQTGVTSSFPDAAATAIAPRIQEIKLYAEGGAWKVYRPESPVLLGIGGDPSQPLSRNPKDPLLLDPDGDGHPGVTVRITIGGFINGELYITRREVYRDHLVLYPTGRWEGHVEDRSEQFVLGANLGILKQPSNNRQIADPGLNPIILVRVPDSVDTWEGLEAIRDSIFPPEPEFLGASGKAAGKA